MQKTYSPIAPLVGIRAPGRNETPLSPSECTAAIAAGAFDGCTLLSDLPGPAQQLLRIVVGAGGRIGRATLRAQSYPLASTREPLQFLADHRLLIIIKSGASYAATAAGAQLVQADAAHPRIAAPRTFFSAESYDGKELRDNSTRPGAYTALRLASRGLLAA